MKKFGLFLILCLLLMSSVYASDIKVQINGEIIDFTDANGAKVDAQIINNRTMVPFRKIFNSLGVTDENITWISETRTVITRKDNIEIELQIDNNIAKKRVDGVLTEIKLDSAPVIYENRTLVPVRFIAESMEKLVGWDATNKTAVIIDFDYFSSQLKAKSNNLYEFLNNPSTTCNLSITRNYYDFDDSTKNNIALVSAQIVETNTNQTVTDNVNVQFSGTNELMKEIVLEGWGNIQFENTYYEDYLITRALNDGLSKVYGQEQMKFKYSALNCEGEYNANFSNALKYICDIEENSIDINTFENLKNDFNNLLNIFGVSSVNVLKTGNINANDLEVKYFDIMNFDNIICDSSVIRSYNFLNSQLFKFDVIWEELCYDFPNINCTINITATQLSIDFVCENEYNEKVQYLMKIDK